ncbi:MAG: tRNA pseudouridine(55) synthase TruB [Oscillospiraceae bacterium]|nr:tRNA pseudouridine(55) synthase TruB [Oscillospiraceae bacterium]
MPNGILIVDKPAGWTSQDVTAKLRGVFHEKRVGHGGTLDPMATGVLPVFIGRATRAVPFFEHADKVYEATLRLGLVTDTQDLTGRPLEEHPVDITQEQLEAVLASFRGEIQQIPPMYSAIKVNGQKLYQLARQGKEIERAARPVTIFELTLVDHDNSQFSILFSLFALRVHCSKGTYVRTLCHDVGAALGCGGCMAALRRTRAGRYCMDQAHTMEEILAAPDPEALLLPVDSLFDDRPALRVPAFAERKLRNGAVVGTLNAVDGEYRVYGPRGDFLLLGEVQTGELRTIRSFFEL